MPQLEPLNIRITGDPRGISTALGRSQSEVRDFGNGLSGVANRLRSGLGGVAAGFAPIGIAATAAFASLAAGAATAFVALSRIRNIQGEIDETAKAADRLGLRFNELGAIRLSLAESAGLDAATADKAIEKLLINLSEAVENEKARANRALSQLGLDAADLITAGPVEALKQIADRTAQITDSTAQLAIAYDLFGRSGTGLASVLRGGSAAIADAASFAERYAGLTEQQVANVEASNDAWGRVNLIVSGLTQELSAELAPLFLTIARETLTIADRFGGLETIVPVLVDLMAELAGNAVDFGEALVSPLRALTAITQGDFSSAFDILEAAADFSRGQEFVARIRETREDLAPAPGISPDPIGDLRALEKLEETIDETSASSTAQTVQAIESVGRTQAAAASSASIYADQEARRSNAMIRALERIERKIGLEPPVLEI